MQNYKHNVIYLQHFATILEKKQTRENKALTLFSDYAHHTGRIVSHRETNVLFIDTMFHLSLLRKQRYHISVWYNPSCIWKFNVLLKVTVSGQSYVFKVMILVCYKWLFRANLIFNLNIGMTFSFQFLSST